MLRSFDCQAGDAPYGLLWGWKSALTGKWLEQMCPGHCLLQRSGGNMFFHPADSTHGGSVTGACRTRHCLVNGLPALHHSMDRNSTADAELLWNAATRLKIKEGFVWLFAPHMLSQVPAQCKLFPQICRIPEWFCPWGRQNQWEEHGIEMGVQITGLPCCLVTVKP